jgi:tetratricopeptide (TPR) repeat protein/transcriptional regulator with XRE-family HTH domain
VFGRLVTAHRRRLTLTQEELADRTGLSVRTIRRLESGEGSLPRPASVRLLADAFALAGAERETFLAAAQPGDPPEPAGVAPAQLPADVRGFAGRRAALARLDRLLPAPGSGPPAMAVAAVSGTGGVGKTTLAVHWAHRVRGRFPDGQLYADLRGYDPSGRMVAPEEVLGGFLAALGVPRPQVPAGRPEQAALFRTLTDGRRLLVILDNARDGDHVRDLLPAAPTIVVVVTSRDRLTGLVAAVGADPLPLDVLSADESAELLANRIGGDRFSAEPAAAARIVAACAGLPLALTITAARVQQATFPIATTAAALAEAGDRLELLDEHAPGGPSAVFSWSYEALSPAARGLFRRLGLHPGPDVSVAAAASLAAAPLGEARRLLRELHRASLIAEPAPDRYALHDLLREFARQLAEQTDPSQDRRAAVVRLLDHYAVVGRQATRLMNTPYRAFEPGPAAPGVVETPLRDERAARDWFTVELEALLAGITLADELGLDRHVCLLVNVVQDFLDGQAHWTDLLRIQHIAAAGARRIGDLRLSAHALRWTARVPLRYRRYDEAMVPLREALGLFEQIEDLDGQCVTNWNIGNVLLEMGRHPEAYEQMVIACRLAEQAGDPHLRVSTLNAVGWALLRLGEPERALEVLREAIAISNPHRPPHSHVVDSLGRTYLALGRFAEAAGCFTETLDASVTRGDERAAGVALLGLGDVHAAAGDAAAARAAWQRALDIYRALGHPDISAVTARLAG